MWAMRPHVPAALEPSLRILGLCANSNLAKILMVLAQRIWVCLNSKLLISGSVIRSSSQT